MRRCFADTTYGNEVPAGGPDRVRVQAVRQTQGRASRHAQHVPDRAVFERQESRTDRRRGPEPVAQGARGDPATVGHRYDFAIGQPVLLYLLFAEVQAVGAVQVFDDTTLIVADELRVVSADEFAFYVEFIIRRTADDDSARRKRMR